MVSLLISLCALILGYLFYGKLAEKIFGPDPLRPTPAQYRADGIDYIKMPGWKVFMIQFLNIAGTGPIFGAIMGAKFGPSAYLWIVFGCIFAGAVHDYFSGMLSVRNGGVGLPELIGKYLGKGARSVMLVFTVVLLILVGAVFVYSPAIILGGMTGGTTTALMIWIGVVFVYYLIATFRSSGASIPSSPSPCSSWRWRCSSACWSNGPPCPSSGRAWATGAPGSA